MPTTPRTPRTPRRIYSSEPCAICQKAFHRGGRNLRYCEKCRHTPEAEEDRRRILTRRRNSWKKKNAGLIKEQKKRHAKRYRVKRRKVKREWDRNARKDDKKRFIDTVRSRISDAISAAMKKGQKVKDRGAGRFLGCTFSHFIEHIESQFVDGMAWSNYGKKGWHVDHIYPLSMANMADPAELRAAMNWRNCRPMWAVENLEKRASVTKKAKLHFEGLVAEFKLGSETRKTEMFHFSRLVVDYENRKEK